MNARVSSKRRIAAATATTTGILAALAVATGLSFNGADAVVPAAAGCEQTATGTLFGSCAPAARIAADDRSSVTLGVRFRTRTGGTVNAIRFYRDDVFPPAGFEIGLWDDRGNLLASGKATIGQNPATGWMTGVFNAAPVVLAPGRTYTAGYRAPGGRYVYAHGGYRTPLTSSSGLTAIAGVFAYGDALTRPTGTYRETNYFVDVQFLPAPSTGTPTTSSATSTTRTTRTTSDPKPTLVTTSVPTPVTTPAGTTTVTNVTAATTSATTPSVATPSTTSAAPTSSAPPSVPSRTANCVAAPSACGFPDATNTGWRHTGVTLKPSGSITVTKDGTVIDGLDIRGTVDVRADNVTIKRSRITSGDYYPIRYFEGGTHTGLLVEDTEIAGTGDEVTASLSFGNYTARRVDAHGGADGFKADANVLIEDSYVHDLAITPTSHNDGVQSTGGSNVTVRHTTIVLKDNANACFQLGNEWGPVSRFLASDNLLSGGGWSVNMAPSGTDRAFVNNRFAPTWGYGPLSTEGAVSWRGNVRDDTGAPIDA